MMLFRRLQPVPLDDVHQDNVPLDNDTVKASSLILVLILARCWCSPQKKLLIILLHQPLTQR
jgi:hypothetical protein